MRRSFLICLSAALSIGATACQSPTQSGPGPAKSDAPAAAADSGVEPRATDPAGKASTPEPGPQVSAEPGSEVREGTPPAWYDETIYADSTVIRKDTAETKLAGGYASAMVLQLRAGTSSSECMGQALGEIAKEAGTTVDDLSTPEVSDDRQMAHGTNNGYDWTIVCGEAKGKPTLYLSYTRS